MLRWPTMESMAPRPRAATWALALCAALGLFLFVARRRPARAGQPFTPATDGEVVETLPRAAGDPRAREEKRLRHLLSAAPRDVNAAARLARIQIEDARATSDPRRLGYAQAALAPWWSAPDAPAEILLLRATIRQSRHEFPAALADLDRAAAAEPGDAQVWLTRAIVLSVLARYDEAAASCAPLAVLSSRLVHTVCLSSVRGVTGQARPAAAALARALVQTPPGDQARPWALSVLAELVGWTGDRAQAERLAREALALDPDDAYTLALLADALLEARRPGEALELLRGREQNDGLLLRMALAATDAGATEAPTLVREMAERFAAARLRGDRLHGREEARFELAIRHDPREALALARANWQVQHEPADALILLQTALAAKDRPAAAPAVAWAAKTGFGAPAFDAALAAVREVTSR